MKAITVTPGTPNSARLRDIPKPSVDDVEGGRRVLVRVLRVGLDGTDRKINAGEYGAVPEGFDYLVLGHESFGVVEEVGPAVTEAAPDDFVVARVRRAGGSLYDRIGLHRVRERGLPLDQHRPGGTPVAVHDLER